MDKMEEQLAYAAVIICKLQYIRKKNLLPMTLGGLESSRSDGVVLAPLLILLSLLDPSNLLIDLCSAVSGLLWKFICKIRSHHYIAEILIKLA
jgi:hypothetical protein